mgnify:CR=1 FL=1
MKRLTLLVCLWGALGMFRAHGAGACAADIAGRALATYPHFEYVKAFNQDEPVQAGIDPSQHPAMAGVDCDLYVVAARAVAV